MSLSSSKWLALVAALASAGPVAAQTFPKPDYFHQMWAPAAVPDRVPGPEGLRDYVIDGKLRLSVDDAVRLTLLNNTNVRVDVLAVDQARNSLLGSYSPFDPQQVTSFFSNRATSPSFTQLAGAPTLSQLLQTTSIGVQQNLDFGGQYNVNFSNGRTSTNSQFNFFNPSDSSSLNFSFTQHLLRNRGRMPNRAPIVIAQRGLNQSRATFQAAINDTVLTAVFQYWDVVLGRENLGVVRKSLAEAEASYNQSKRALELGALPPLDIYRSESEVAARRLSVIQAEYQLKQSEDIFRRTVGADLDPYVRALDLDLVEKTEPTGELISMDIESALKRALANRPELEAVRQQLAVDETNVRVFHNQLLPDLSLALGYTSNGLGGNQFNTAATPPVLVSRGGFGDALGQVFGFGFPAYGFTLQLNLPIRNRGARANLGNALVSRRRDLYFDRQTRQGITLEVTNAVHTLEEAKLSIAAAKIARDLSEKNVQAEQRKFELGEQTIFFVLEAQTELAQAEASLVQAEVNYQRAVSQVDHATGGLLDRYHVQIAQTIH
jgi:outer membrane protein